MNYGCVLVRVLVTFLTLCSKIPGRALCLSLHAAYLCSALRALRLTMGLSMSSSGVNGRYLLLVPNLEYKIGSPTLLGTISCKKAMILLGATTMTVLLSKVLCSRFQVCDFGV